MQCYRLLSSAAGRPDLAAAFIDDRANEKREN